MVLFYLFRSLIIIKIKVATRGPKKVVVFQILGRVMLFGNM